MSSTTWGDEMSYILASLYLDAIFYCLLGLYLEEVLPRQYGVPKHPLFFLPSFSQATRTPVASELETPLNHASNDDDEDDDEDLGEGVAEERDYVKSQDPSDRGMNAVLIEGLKVVYPPKGGAPAKEAVKDLWLSVRRGETLGLLGHNGAGKTSTIQVLTGLHEQSQGKISIGGHLLPEGLEAAHLKMGLCPQHDVLWGSLTVEALRSTPFLLNPTDHNPTTKPNPNTKSNTNPKFLNPNSTCRSISSITYESRVFRLPRSLLESIQHSERSIYFKTQKTHSPPNPDLTLTLTLILTLIVGQSASKET